MTDGDFDHSPAGWSNALLKTICEKLVDGSHLPPSKQIQGYPMLSARNISNSGIHFDEFRYISATEYEIENRRTRIRPGDVLLTIVGTIGRTTVVPESAAPFVLQRSVAVLQSSVLDPKFFSYQLQADRVQAYFRREARGTAQKGVYLNTLGELPMKIAPLAEQRRIVAEIERHFSRLDAAIAALERARARLKRYRAAVLESACEGKLVVTEHEVAQSTSSTFETGELLLKRLCSIARSDRDEQYVDLPRGWSHARVGELVDVGTGATPLRSNRAYYEDGTTPWVTSGALNSAWVDTVDEYITVRALRETNAKVFPSGTLLVAMYGEGKTRGKVSELRIDAATNQACAALVFNTKTEVLRAFVKIYFEGNYEALRRQSSGGVQPNLNLSVIRDLLVPIPPLNEQARIVTEVEVRTSITTQMETEVNSALRRAERLRQSILKRAFEGHLVPQDPADEPASVLLERIRRERDENGDTAPLIRKPRPLNGTVRRRRITADEPPYEIPTFSSRRAVAESPADYQQASFPEENRL